MTRSPTTLNLTDRDWCFVAAYLQAGSAYPTCPGLLPTLFACHCARLPGCMGWGRKYSLTHAQFRSPTFSSGISEDDE